jgi:FkbM family methyltransferase
MTYYALCGSVSLSNKTNITCINAALGSFEQLANLENDENGNKSILLNIISNDGGGSSIKDVNDNILCKEKVILKTLDSYNLKDISFIKIDVEGAELDVLQGGVNTIKESNPHILFECNDCTGQLGTDLFFYLYNEFGYNIVPVSGTNNMFLAYYDKLL